MSKCFSFFQSLIQINQIILTVFIKSFSLTIPESYEICCKHCFQSFLNLHISCCPTAAHPYSTYTDVPAATQAVTRKKIVKNTNSAFIPLFLYHFFFILPHSLSFLYSNVQHKLQWFFPQNILIFQIFSTLYPSPQTTLR